MAFQMESRTVFTPAVSYTSPTAMIPTMIVPISSVVFRFIMKITPKITSPISTKGPALVVTKFSIFCPIFIISSFIISSPSAASLNTLPASFRRIPKNSETALSDFSGQKNRSPFLPLPIHSPYRQTRQASINVNA